jgi:hypothetical protein
MVLVTAVAEGDIDLEKKTHAINRLADDVALSLVPRGKTPPVSVAFDLKALQGRRGEGTEDAQPTMATPPPAVKQSGGGSAARASTPAPVKPAAPPAAPAAAPAAPAAGSLAAARQLKATNPADAYAALKAIVKASPTSADGKAAAQDMAAIEQDAAMSKKIMSAEGKAYSSLSMAQNFQNSGQAEKAQQRYEQIIKDFPDTMSAAVAQKKLAELKAAGSK